MSSLVQDFVGVPRCADLAGWVTGFEGSVLVGELDEMERVGDLGGVGWHCVERRAPWSRQVQHRIANRVQPLLRLPSEPLTRRGGRTALDHVQ